MTEEERNEKEVEIICDINGGKAVCAHCKIADYCNSLYEHGYQIKPSQFNDEMIPRRF